MPGCPDRGTAPSSLVFRPPVLTWVLGRAALRLALAQKIPDEGQDGCRAVGLQAAVVDCGCAGGGKRDQHWRALDIAEQELVLGPRSPVEFALALPRARPQPIEGAGEPPDS